MESSIFTIPNLPGKFSQFKDLIREWNKLSTKSSSIWYKLQNANDELKSLKENKDLTFTPELCLSQPNLTRAIDHAEKALEQLIVIKDHLLNILNNMIKIINEEKEKTKINLSFQEWLDLQIEMHKKDLANKELILESVEFGMSSNQLQLYSTLWSLQPQIQSLKSRTFDFEM